METSSPIAAMQANPLMPSWARSNIYSSNSHGNFSSNIFGPGAFNFRDLSMKKANQPDYFGSGNPLHGSSPTTSLAADLSQNFHIDMSPQLPTPRRSLFTSNLLAAESRELSVLTPPLHPSTPGPLHEHMDISPLPHKQPHFAQIEMMSPSPVNNSEDNIPSSPPLLPFSEINRSNLGVERKKSILSRPGLARAKGLSTNSVPCRKLDSSQHPFRFGAGSSKLSNNTTMSLEECFHDSPSHEFKSPLSASPLTNNAPRLGKAFVSNASGVARQTGSPLGTCARRPYNPLIRPRKQFRRSLSMFENPCEMVNAKMDESVVSNLQTVMDIDELYQPVLPHFFKEGSPDSIPRISQNTLLRILDGEFSSQFDEQMIIDCRFEYEFVGGHINGAINFNDKELLSGKLFVPGRSKKTLLVFHCEYSAHRAPIMARHIRKQDRANNAEQYPKLTYPDVYILDGGYSSFFSQYRSRCYPQNYVEMDDKEHVFTCEREMGRLRQNRSKFSRAQTFAFGQAQVEDSPTAPHRCRTNASNDIETMSGISSPISCGRRLVSY
ncbi:BgtA-20025 [Blumeria graminis f. sp. tritici]|uniref:M-phase inducer phosphatase n=2 Tax=Blumeria graminis f. sp. tritici TaxID=62690 RepID=A0A9X9QEL6_BLUGR|nr:hypothetical protein BGT96224_A20025 [Blumeria graminis f. sp. tritici 96224]VDB91018.1 BgtA-20025 [Blumeria graminis f. sp. tritici]